MRDHACHVPPPDSALSRSFRTRSRSLSMSGAAIASATNGSGAPTAGAVPAVAVTTGGVSNTSQRCRRAYGVPSFSAVCMSIASVPLRT